METLVAGPAGAAGWPWRLTANPALLVGESFGGALALSFALAHPDRVAGLVIVNSFPYFGPQLRLRLGHPRLSLMPWGAMRLVRPPDGVADALAGTPTATTWSASWR